MDYNTPIRPYTGNQLPARRPAVAGQTQGRDNRFKVPTARQAFQQGTAKPAAQQPPNPFQMQGVQYSPTGQTPRQMFSAPQGQYRYVQTGAQPAATAIGSQRPAASPSIGETLHRLDGNSVRGQLAKSIMQQSPRSESRLAMDFYNPFSPGYPVMRQRNRSEFDERLKTPDVLADASMPAFERDGNAYVSKDLGSYRQKYGPDSATTIGALGWNTVANHELEHVRQATGEVKSPVARENKEVGPVIGDIAFSAEEFANEFERPLDHTANFPGGISHDADWMARQARQHGYFDGNRYSELIYGMSSGVPMHDLIFGTSAGRQWFNRMANNEGSGVAPLPNANIPGSMERPAEFNYPPAEFSDADLDSLLRQSGAPPTAPSQSAPVPQAPATPPSMSQQRPPVAPAIDAKSAIPLAVPATQRPPEEVIQEMSDLGLPRQQPIERDSEGYATPEAIQRMVEDRVAQQQSSEVARAKDILNRAVTPDSPRWREILSQQAAAEAGAREAFAQTMDQARQRGIDTASTQAGFRPGELDARVDRAREMFTSPTGYTVPGTTRVVARDGVLMTPGRLGGNYPVTAAEERLQAAEEARRAQVTAAPRLTPDQMAAFTNANTLNFDGVDMTGQDADAIMNARYQQRLAANPVATTPEARRAQLLDEQLQRRAVRTGIYEPGRTTADYRNMFAEAEANEQLMPRQEAELALRQDRANRMMSQMPGTFTPEQQEAIAASANPLVSARAALSGVRDARRQQAAEANARSVMMNNLAMRDPRAFANLAATNASAEARMAMNQADNATRMNVTEREASARETIAGNQLTQADRQFQARQESERLQHAERMAQLEANNASTVELARIDREFQEGQQEKLFAHNKEMKELDSGTPTAKAEEELKLLTTQKQINDAKKELDTSPNEVTDFTKIDYTDPTVDPDKRIMSLAFNGNMEVPDAYNRARSQFSDIPAMPSFSITQFSRSPEELNSPAGVEHVADTYFAAAGYQSEPGVLGTAMREVFGGGSDGVSMSVGSFDPQSMHDADARQLMRHYEKEGGNRSTLGNWLNSELKRQDGAAGAINSGNPTKKAQMNLINKMLGNPPIDWRPYEAMREQIMRETANPVPTY